MGTFIKERAATSHKALDKEVFWMFFDHSDASIDGISPSRFTNLGHLPGDCYSWTDSALVPALHYHLLWTTTHKYSSPCFLRLIGGGLSSRGSIDTDYSFST